MSRGGASPSEKGRFERFWNRLFTYAYDCDKFSTFLVNETFFIAAALVLAWLCSLTVYLNVRFLAWIALFIRIIGDAYFIISFYIGIQTIILTVIRKRRAAKEPDPPESKPKKPAKRKYKISNRRF